VDQKARGVKGGRRSYAERNPVMVELARQHRASGMSLR
jgi:hypothetical protein